MNQIQESARLLSKLTKEGEGRGLNFYSFAISNSPNLRVPKDIDEIEPLNRLIEQVCKKIDCNCKYHSVKDVTSESWCVYKLSVFLNLFNVKKTDMGELK